jgi:glycosyltransferase involved in cell wall biosynthesis
MLVPYRAIQMSESDINILLVGTFGGGGIHHYIENLVVHLPDKTSTTTYDMRSEPKGEGIKWLLMSIVLSAVAAVRFPVRQRPDLVHVHSSHAFSFYRAAFYVFVVSALWRRPIVFHIHGSSFDSFLETDSWLVRAVQSSVFERCDRIVVLSDYWQQVLGKRVSERKISVVPNAVDPELFDPEYDHDPTRVTFVSSLIQRKGVQELIEAVDNLAADGSFDFELSIAGSGPLRGSVEALAARHEHVTYHGFVSEQEKRRLFSTGDVFVLPSHAEGLPIAMLEAMAGGNAVVSTTVGSIPEVIDDDGGVLVKPGDSAGLADAVGSLVEEGSSAGRMGRTNRSLVCEEYAWTTVAERITRIYYESIP